MDFEKLLKLSLEHLSEYVEVFVTTFQSPRLRFSPLVSQGREQTSILTSSHQDDAHSTSRINPKLLVFVLISIFLGLTVASFVPGRKEAPDIVKAILLVVCFWFAISSLLYLICKLLRGRGSFVETVSISLQIIRRGFCGKQFSYTHVGRGN